MTTAALARCPHKACPVRYRGGPDRLCPQHQNEDTTWTARLEQMQDTMAAPGEHDGDGTGGGRRAEDRARRDTGHSR